MVTRRASTRCAVTPIGSRAGHQAGHRGITAARTPTSVVALAAVALALLAATACTGSAAAPSTDAMTTAVRSTADQHPSPTTTPGSAASQATATATSAGTANVEQSGPQAPTTGPSQPVTADTRQGTGPVTVTRTTPPPVSRTTRTPPPATVTRTTTVITTPSTPRPPTTAPRTSRSDTASFRFPVPVDVGNATELITVAVANQSSTEGTLTAWQRTSSGWRPDVGPVHAYLGAEGIGTSSEQHSRTPQGTFTLTQGFGRQPDPGTALPYFRTDLRDWWVSDVDAPSYNTHQRCAAAACPFDTGVSEQLNLVDPEYDYAVVIDANMNPVVPGAGSAFFLHVADGEPTAGCVAIDRGTLVTIMRWLDPAQHPRIAIGVG